MEGFLIKLMGIVFFGIIIIGYFLYNNYMETKYNSYLVEGKYRDFLKKADNFKQRSLNKYK